MNPSAGIESRPNRVAAKHAKGRQRTSRPARRHGIALEIDCRVVRNGVAALHSGKISKDALTRLCGQHIPYNGIACCETLAVIQKEEECLVLKDRSAEPSAKLVPVIVILRNAVKIVEPIAGVERRIPVRIKDRTAELVGSRARRHLDLAAPPSQLRICGRDDDAYLLHQVRTGIRNRIRAAVIVPRIVDTNAVPRGVHISRLRAGKDAEGLCAHPARESTDLGPDQIQHIPPHQRKIP